jgi:hypothetical protein
MAFIAKQSEGREPQAAGLYNAVCYGLVDLGTQPPGQPQYKPRQQVKLFWELVDEDRVEYERDGVKQSFKPNVNRDFPLSLGGGQKPTEFRKILESWRGRPFTTEELAGFDVRTILGANCALTIVHVERGGSTYANVGSVSPIMKGAPKRQAETPRLLFSLDDIADGQPLIWPTNMPQWVRTKIMKSHEYILRFEGGSQDDIDAGHEQAPPHDDENIPF